MAKIQNKRETFNCPEQLLYMYTNGDAVMARTCLNLNTLAKTTAVTETDSKPIMVEGFSRK